MRRHKLWTTLNSQLRGRLLEVCFHRMSGRLWGRFSRQLTVPLIVRLRHGLRDILHTMLKRNEI